MSNKKNKRLIISIGIFVGLAIILTLLLTLKKDSNFKEILNPAETVAIDKIEIVTVNSKAPIILKKEGDDWKVSKNDTIYTANNLQIENILKNTTNLKPARVVAVSKDKYEENNFNEESATQVKYYVNNKLVANYKVGGFEYRETPSNTMGGQPRQEIFTYIKEPKSDILYAVQGFLTSMFSDDINSYRNRNIYQINKDDILEIVGIFDDGINNFSLLKDADNWIYNGNTIEDENDIKKTDSYLQRLAHLTLSEFYDKGFSKDITETITIKGNNFSPITLYFYPLADTEDYIIEPNTYNEGVFIDRNGAQRSRMIFEL